MPCRSNREYSCHWLEDRTANCNSLAHMMHIRTTLYFAVYGGDWRVQVADEPHTGDSQRNLQTTNDYRYSEFPVTVRKKAFQVLQLFVFIVYRYMYEQILKLYHKMLMLYTK